MKNMKIKTKLVTGFLLLALLTAIVGGIGIYSLRVTANETQLLNERATMAILSVRLARNVNQQRAAYLGVVAFDEIEEYADAERYKESLSSLADDFDGLVYDLESMLTVDEAKQRLSDIKTVYADYVIKREELMAIMDDVSARRLAMTNDDPSESLKSVDRIRQDVGSALLSVGDTAGVLVENVVSLTDFIESVADKQAADVEATAEKVTIISVIILVIAVAIAILLGLYISSVISKPVNLMMGFLRQVGETGNLTFSEEALGNMRESMKYRDETSQSLAAFVRMLEHLIRCGTALQSVAAHDLTVRVETLGVSDTIGNALTTMVSNLNDMFDEINVASSQVSGGSQQIANGAQSLAQGASEQAASVEELSAAIAEVSASIKDAAESARGAAEMSDGIRLKAERGSEQMNAMMEAVQAINDASQSIGKVIKVIDDIAFQTNILALNAAVEAARAGNAGRGFAVVAEEVRNLAAKSAEAAQDTEALIENSISRAVLGVKIAGETNESLIEIVDGIVQSSRIAGEIAESADRQYNAIGEINTGIDQVSQVVQQNSATAEESAAASEELSSQSSMLSGLIGQFKLRGATGSGAYLSRAVEEPVPIESVTPRIALDAKSYVESHDKY